MVASGGRGHPTATSKTTRIEGGTQILSAGMRNTIQTIKEIVGNHSDADIYFTLKDSNMDPNETAQKLLNQDPFLEVKRRRDKKKENMSYKSLEEPRKNSEIFGKTMRIRTYADRNARRRGYNRNALPGINREFRVVRDNRVNPEANQETKSPLPQSSISTNEKVTNVKEKGSPTGTTGSEKPSGGRSFSQASNGSTNLHPRHAYDHNITGTDRIEPSAEKFTTSAVNFIQHNITEGYSATLASSNSVGGYFSSKDPVHVPSPDSRASSAVGAIKREVGVVGGGRQCSDNAVKDSTAPCSSFSNSILGRDNSDSFRPFPSISKADQINQIAATDSGVAGMPANRALFTNQYTGRSHQQSVGHQKASQHNKEWKPKSSQKSNVIGPGVIGTPTKSPSPPVDDSKDLESDVAKLQDELSRVNIHENQNVIIAQHIRVPETDRCRLTFGSFGVDFESSRNLGSGFLAAGSAEESNGESAASLTGAASKTSGNDVSGRKPVDILDDLVRNSGSNSPASGEASEHQLPDDIKDASSPQDLDGYADIGLVRDTDPSYPLSESQQQQDSSELASFPQAYDSQTGYDMSYFRPTMDESVRGQGLPSPQEALASHSANSIPASSIAMLQHQQQPQMAQMYPQVHVSHFPNMMPYRQIISPVYVPQMAMPGYSSNPAYPHPSNGSSYLLMPGGSSHLSTNGLKYGIQQFKPVPTASPTGFGNFTSPAGYAINAPSVVGSVTGLEDSSRMKYKDGNLYVSNQQADTSELWIHNPRELPGMQSGPYYNMPAQTPHAAAYLPSHAGHASFNAAVPQSSHMQFPGMYHPTAQPPAMANPHHMGPAMGGNVGVGVPPAAPGAQVGAYQQPQLGNFNWSPNF
ncbi:hypothetical protein KPL70_020228 [Citrus sinensis]|uniref:GBF-interacting protein 1-like isoform X5 n=1 Tax=Citrus sinensis TaxID=2711 RepID=UPI000CED5DD6|nr:GBF-interacting protein 1-like isoform X5 [Citrus sinensis]XP_024036092.1 GBF-interacting protein 1-like isoform X5 [Citrus x clementina]KAH9665140.1 hypothetical protein KPL70_020228 [Citrus sinensis]